MRIRIALTAMLLLSVSLLFHCQATACELLGLSFNESVPFQHVFSAFQAGGKENPDGWGVALYSDKSVTLFKEAANATESPLAEFLTSYEALRGKLLVAHVRDATVGGQSHQNTHPFSRELDGKEYALAHNGTLKEFRDKLELSRLKPLGTTDSEHLLCYLLGRIESKSVVEWDKQSFEWLQNELHTINGTGSLNCVFSDGTYLFAYHDEGGYKTLYHLKRTAPHGNVRFVDLPEETELSGLYRESAVGVIVATRPLSDEPWVAFIPGQLLVFKDGVKIFPEMPTSSDLAPEN